MSWGYMGFGMKKENYTRKPRKAFEKRKELFDTQSVRSTFVRSRDGYSVTNQHWRGDKLAKSTKIITTILLSIALAGILYVIAIDPIIHSYKKKKFELVFFGEHFVEHRKDYAALFHLHDELPMVHIFELDVQGSLFIVVKSEDFDYKKSDWGDNVVNLMSTWRKNYKSFSVDEGILYVERIDKKYSVQNNWAIAYRGDVSDEITTDKVARVLDLTRDDLLEYKTTLGKSGLQGIRIDDKGRIHLLVSETRFGNYEIVTAQQRLHVQQDIRHGELGKNIFWIEK